MKKIYPAVKLNQEEVRMLLDDDYFDVDCRKVKAFIRKLNVLKYSRKTVIKMRVKYDPWLTDREKEIMDQFGLDYETHRVGPKPRKAKLSDCVRENEIYIDGYTPTQWRLLTDDNYVPPALVLTKMLNACKQFGDEEGLRILQAKYENQIKEANQLRAKRHGLPEDIEFDEDDRTKIDGLSPFCWKLLHDPSFEKPKKSVLVSAIHQLRHSGRIEEADKIEERYFAYLYPRESEEKRYIEIEKAENRFLELFPDNEKLKETIKYRRKCRNENNQDNYSDENR